MITPLRQPFPVRTFKILAFLAVFLFPALGQAQCPIAAGCTPGNPPGGNVVFGMGILNVNVNNGAINNTTAGVSATTGYVNYSCTIGTTLTATVTYPISIQTNLNVNENVRVWIDYDNNGSFNATSELAFSSNNKTLHTGTITIPATAVINTPLRMRVSADNFSSQVPTPCSTPQYSQVEDYSITVVPNTNPPSAAFTVSNTTTCSPTVAFQNQTQGGATSWQWNFGDAGSATNTSTLQNPSHTFSATGTYTVTLIACNAIGCDTLVKTNYITYHTNVPVAASCTPATANFCCGYGITNVNFGNGLMVNASANGSVGYEDFTCTKSVSVLAGSTHPFTITTGGTNPHDTRIYIDYDNNGSFSAAEMVFERLNTANPFGTITFPATATVNMPLRMRIISDEIGSAFTACSGIQSGQAEDYTIIVNPDPFPPIAKFSGDLTNLCSGQVIFKDLSLAAPTSWQWNFGDGNTSTLQNPTHNYATGTAGNYTVTLIACNTFGCDTLVMPNYVAMTVPCQSYCPSAGHNNVNSSITTFDFGSFNNTSGIDANGYGNYLNLNIDLIAGRSYPVSVLLGGSIKIGTSARVMIDLNKDRIFQASEVVFEQGAYRGPGNPFANPLTGTILIPLNALPGPTRMRVISSQSISYSTNPCVQNQPEMEVEDYTVTIVPNNLPLQATFFANIDSICTGKVMFTDLTENGPTSWLWDFGDGTTSNLQNPTHIYATGTPADYDVTLTVCKNRQCDTKTVANQVHITVPCNAYCKPANKNNDAFWITRVKVGSIDNSSGKALNGYANYLQHETELVIGRKNNQIIIEGCSFYNYVQVWIDFNRDRVFQPSEKLVDNLIDIVPLSNGQYGIITAFDVPGNALPGPTRLRVIGQATQYANDPCVLNRNVGDTEDYTVILVADTAKPSFNFTSDRAITCNGQVAFSATSDNELTTWSWDFGDPASGAANNTSTLANPTHTFSAPGVYNVTLTACNAVGCKTIAKGNFVNYDPGNIVCRSVIMNQTQANGSFDCSGMLYDSGGPNAGYLHLTKSHTVLRPTGAATVSLTFHSFDIMSGYDSVMIYDGFDIFAPRIGMYTGNTLPNNGLPITSTRGGLTVELVVSNGGQVLPGFEASWSCNMPASPPVADFTYALPSGSYHCFDELVFKDLSTNGPSSWLWNFDDPGSTTNTSTLQNPHKDFYNYGTHLVSLVVCNGIGCDTVSKSVYLRLGSPITAVCYPFTVVRQQGYGIGIVSFNQLYNNSQTAALALSGYQSFMCSSVDSVLAGNTYNLSVTNSGTLPENVKAWIDYNNNGTFETNELVMNSTNKTNHTAAVTIPLTALRNQYLRLRIISDEAGVTIADGCHNSTKSEIEDYRIIVVNSIFNSVPAVAIKPNLEIYPNPTTGNVTVKLENPTSEAYQLEVTNILGQVLLHKSADLTETVETQLDLSGYSKGVYFIRVSNSRFSGVKKVIVE